MCSSPEELREKAQWGGAQGKSRQQLLATIQKHVPPSLMIPENRLEALLTQAKQYQKSTCVYHNVQELDFLLLEDHSCNRQASCFVERKKKLGVSNHFLFPEIIFQGCCGRHLRVTQTRCGTFSSRTTGNTSLPRPRTGRRSCGHWKHAGHNLFSAITKRQCPFLPGVLTTR